MRRLVEVKSMCMQICALLFLTTVMSAAESSAPTSLQPFLKANCLECHDTETAKGGLDLTRLPYGTDPLSHTKWVRVFDRVIVGDMPPAKKTKPAAAAIKTFTAQLEKDLTVQHLSMRGTVMRRLNRIEYRNTMEDLLGMRIGMYEELPEDALAQGFDNNGEALGLSSVHLRRYLSAAEYSLNHIELRSSAPERTKRVLSYAETGGGKRAINEKMWLQRSDGAVVLFSAGSFPSTILDNLKITDGGMYRIRMNAHAWQSDKPMTMALWLGNFGPGGDNRLYGYYRIPCDAPGTVELTTWLRAGDTIRPLIENLKFPQDVKKNGTIASYKGPGLAVSSIEVDGPIDAPFPARGQKLLFADLPVKIAPPSTTRGKVTPPPEIITTNPQQDGERFLRNFATAAFRRPATNEQLAPVMSLLRAELTSGASFVQATYTAASAILCAPEFLFLLEKTTGKDARLDDYAIASRLSYLLWRSGPDDELLRAAGAGELRTVSGLKAQVERLLAHQHLQRFIKDFTDGWLDLRNIDFTSPDRKFYPEFDDELQFSMAQETRAFITELLLRNELPTNLITSNFVMLNERLAKHYQIAGVTGLEIRRVTLPADSHRGGLLTQGSVLKVSANGTNTSPIIRGVYVMERILGYHPPPPPPGVAGFEPDIRGATTIREQLDKHRHLESCNGCHRILDPPGFALERFDVIGGWRERLRTFDQGERINTDRDGRHVTYRLGPQIDASGEIIGVGEFKDFEDFRRLLLTQQDRVTANLAARLLSFGTGREMGFSDRAKISNLVKTLGPNGGVRDLLHLVVQSDIFLSK